MKFPEPTTSLTVDLDVAPRRLSARSRIVGVRVYGRAHAFRGQWAPVKSKFHVVKQILGHTTVINAIHWTRVLSLRPVQPAL